MADRRKHLLLIKACANGDQDFIKKNVTKKTVDLNYVDNISGSSLLESACQCLGSDVFTDLLKKDGVIERQDNKGRTLMFMAIERRQVELTLCLIKNGTSLDITDQNKIHLLSHAAHTGDIQTAQALLSTKKLYIKKHYLDLLQLAIKCKDLSTIKSLLIKMGTAKNDKDSFKCSPLLFSCRFGNIETTKLLLHNKAKIDTADHDRKNPLLTIIRRCRPEADENEKISQEELLSLMRLVLANGININETDMYGWSALHHAVHCQNIPVIELLLSQKCDLNQQSISSFNGILTAATALYIAVAADNKAAVEVLCQAGADCNLAVKQQLRKKASPPEYISPLFTAVDNQNLTVAALLHQHGAKIDMVTQISYKRTTQSVMDVFLKADMEDKVTFISNILDQGFDINTTDSNGNTLVQMILQHSTLTDKNINILDIVRRCKSFNINQQNCDGETIVITALKALYIFSYHLCDRRKLAIISFLKNVVAANNVNIQDKTGQTAMHYFLPAFLECYGREELIKDLQKASLKCLVLGAKIDNHNKDGLTPFHQFVNNQIAERRRFGPPELDKAIRKMFMVPDDADFNGLTALHTMVLANRQHILSLFLSEPDYHSLKYINARYIIDISRSESLVGLTALQICILQCGHSNESWDIPPYLLRSGADIHVHYRNVHNYNSLMKQAITSVAYKMNSYRYVHPSVHLDWSSALFHILFMLMSAGAPFTKNDIEAAHTHLYDNLEVALIKQKVCLPMLRRAVRLGYTFNRSHLSITLDNINPEMCEIINSSRKVLRLDNLSAQTVRQNLYPNAWYGAKQLKLPEVIYTEHFETYQNTLPPKKFN